jgi:hypothetical protein
MASNIKYDNTRANDSQVMRWQNLEISFVHIHRKLDFSCCLQFIISDDILYEAYTILISYFHFIYNLFNDTVSRSIA